MLKYNKEEVGVCTMFTDITAGTRAAPELVSAVASEKQKQQQADEKFSKTDSVVRSDETYFSPIVKIDAEAQKAFFIYRDRETGEVKQQFPPEQVSASYLKSAGAVPDSVEEIKADDDNSEPTESLADAGRANKEKTISRQEVNRDAELLA